MNIYGQVGWRAAAAVNPFVTDADALAFVTAASITNTTQQSAINTLVTQLKGYGIWTKMKAVYPFVGGNASAHKFNLKDPRDLNAAYRLTFGGGWTHSSTGAQPNGTNGYANTFFIPNTQTQYNQHLSYYTTNNGMALSGRYKSWLGAYHTSWETGYTGLHEFYIGAGNTSVSSAQYSETNVNNFVKKSETSPIGFWTGTRLTSGLDLRLFKNGTKVDTITASPASQYQPDHNTYLGAMHVKYVGQDYTDNFSDNNTAFASIGDGLSDTEAANFYTAVQAYQTTLGRQV